MLKPIEIALQEYGTKEIEGIKNNPRVVEYFAKCGNSWVHDDETSWCAAFVGYCLETAGIKSTKKLNARSYLTWGTKTTTPKLGDVAVMWRITPTSPYGHVGFYITERDEMVYLLAGNQNNEVNIVAYPKSRFLGYATY